MKRLLLALALLCIPSLAMAQCNGVFGANTVCGRGSTQGIPGQIPTSSFASTPGGVSDNVQYNNGSGGFGGYTDTQLTTHINAATATLPGALPAWPNNTTTYFRGDGTYATIPYPVTALCGLTGAPTATQITACLNLFSSTLQGLAPASGGGTTNYLRADGAWTAPPGTVTSAASSLDNLLSNVQWQQWTGVTWVTTQNAAGTNSEVIPTCASFTTATQGPVFTCANTQTLKVGDLIVVSNIVSFWGFAGAGYLTCVQVNCTNGYVTAAKITALTTNTSVTLISPGFGGVSPVGSTSANLAPITPGDLGSSTNGPDGWTKTSTLIVTVDTWGAAATPASTVYPGCERPLLVRKGITGTETLQRSVPANAISRYQGQTETFGAVVYQRVQGGASTWHLAITDSTGSTSGSNGTGASKGGYEFLPVTRTIAQTATSSEEVISFDGNSGDVFDVCLPTAAFVPSMVQSQLHQNAFEKIKATSHANPPTMTPFIIQFPGSPISGTTTLWGYNSNDIESLSFGAWHNTLQYIHCKLEWTSTSVGHNVFVGGNVNVTNGLTFGLQAATQVSGVVFPTSDTPMPLYHDGTFALYMDIASVTPTSGTFDCGDSEVTPGNAVN